MTKICSINDADRLLACAYVCVRVQLHQIYDAVGLKDAARAAKRAEPHLTQHGRPATAPVSMLVKQEATHLTTLYIVHDTKVLHMQ
jgi:hypothetical protein